MFCARCGSKLADSAGFCPNCGLVVGTADQVQRVSGQQSVPGQFQPQTENSAIPTLILGILALFFSIITGIPAIILGHMSLSKIKKSAGHLTGEGMALAGLILGYVSVALVPLLLMIAIPNLVRSREAANTAAAVSTVRTLIYAETTYSTTYPKAGYSPDLATLGPGGPMCAGGEGTQKNACLIGGDLGCSAGSSGNWCDKDEYRYSIVGFYKNGVPDDFVITAIPASSSAGKTSFCATSDGIVRSHPGAPPSQPIKTVAECSSWIPL